MSKKAKQNTETETGTVYDSMSQCAAALGIDKETLRGFKSRGCPAFRGSRIHKDELLRWVSSFRNPGPQRALSLEERLEELHQNLAVAAICMQVFLEEHDIFPKALACLEGPMAEARGELFRCIYDVDCPGDEMPLLPPEKR